MSAKPDKRRTRYAFVEWTDPAKPPGSDGHYRAGSYPESDLPRLLDQLRSAGVDLVYVNDDPRWLSDGAT